MYIQIEIRNKYNLCIYYIMKFYTQKYYKCVYCRKIIIKVKQDWIECIQYKRGNNYNILYFVKRIKSYIFSMLCCIVDREDENNTVAILVREKDKCYILIKFQIIYFTYITFFQCQIVDRNAFKYIFILL